VHVDPGGLLHDGAALHVAELVAPHGHLHVANDALRRDSAKRRLLRAGSNMFHESTHTDTGQTDQARTEQ